MESFEITHDGKVFIFVSNGDFSIEDAHNYLLENYNNTVDKPQDAQTGFIPFDRHKERMFLNDYRQMGLGYCVQKYGQNENAVQAEVSRIMRMRTRNG